MAGQTYEEPPDEKEAKHSTSHSHEEMKCTETIRDGLLDSLAFAIISISALSMPHVCLMYALLSQLSFVHLCVHHTDQHQAAWTATSQPSLVCEEVDAEGGDSDVCGLDTFDTTELSGVHAALRELDSVCRLDMSKSLVRRRITVGSCNRL